MPCPTHKLEYYSRKEAAQALRRSWKQNANSVYKCPICPHWHLGRKHKQAKDK